MTDSSCNGVPSSFAPKADYEKMVTPSLDPLPPALKQQNDTGKYANRHVPRFLEYKDDKEKSPLQVATDGSQLTASNFLSPNVSLNMSNPILITDTPTSIGMKVPTSKKKRVFTVRDVMNVIGHYYPVSVIDVALQEELEGWTMEDLVDYFEDESRRQEMDQEFPVSRRPQRRAAAEAARLTHKSRPKVLNQISMEFSKTPLQRLVASPRFVRDLDWIDHVWPRDLREKGEYPVVQHYCLTSTCGCYTDFHVDFGGTSVWYHVLNGRKCFMLIPPTISNLAAYEDWLCRPNQSELFFPDMLDTREGVVKVTLEASQTLLIPTGWIHAVYTPVDSVVVGGNFLHGLDINLQLQVYCVETRAKVRERFRFPHFCAIQYHAGGYYLNKMRKGKLCKREVEGIPHLLRALRTWWTMHSKEQSQKSNQKKKHITPYSAANHAARLSNCDSVEQMLDCIEAEHERILKNGICPNPMIALKTEAKPKLRLRLSGSTPPTSAENSPQPKMAEDVDVEKDTKFRIMIPHSSTYALARPKKRLLSKREDLDGGSILTRNDEEWRPRSGGSKRLKTNSIATKSRRPQMVRSSESKTINGSGQALTKGTTAVKKKAAMTTARQRLMKRFR